MRRLTSYIFLTFALAQIVLFLGCAHKTRAWTTLDTAETMLHSRPDSALTILSTIDKERLGDKEEKARYALLMSMALDKNYIDTTSFEVLQPAIDFYFKHGTPDDKLRTLYYQGRIFQNQGNDDSALASFMKATELKNLISDSLLLAHTLVAIGIIDLEQYKIERFIKHNMDAAKLYAAIDCNVFAAKSYANALGGYVMLKDKFMSDSILSVCLQLSQQLSEASAAIYPAYLSYIVEYGDLEDLDSHFNKFQNEDLSSEDRLDFARGYSRLGQYDRASSILSDYIPSGSLIDSLKYMSIETNILAKRGDYEQAFALYENYSSMMERHQQYLMSNDLLFAEERHHIEMDNLKQLQNIDIIIWMTLCGIFALTIFVGWLYYRYRLNKSGRILAEKDNTYLKLEQEKLCREKELVELERNKKTLEADILEKENKRLWAEQQQRILEAENLILEKERLEGERDNLTELLQQQSGLTESLRKIVKTRLSMLNSVLAKDITNEESYAKPYRKWIESIRKDKEEFKNSTREAFLLSHPMFMEHLTSHGLSVDEINYLCLYALGLRGKDVGEYINLKRHYNISSEIRKKLGINEHETNIGPYVRRLMETLDSQ